VRRTPIVVVLIATSTLAADRPLGYPIVDTGQAICYDNRHDIAVPKPGQTFYGQDA
jgi:hypothetical protein